MTEEVAVVEAVADPVEVNNDAASQPEATADPVEEVKPEVKPEKTFTQKELDEILQKRLAKESRKIERYSRAEAELRLLKEQMQQKPEPVVNRGEPKPEQFKDYESYLDALTDWKVESKLKGMEERKAQERQREAQTEHESKLRENVVKASSKYDDFEDVVTNPQLPITIAMRDAIGESDMGGDIAYYLGLNVHEAERIAGLSPIGQVKAILSLEAKLKAPEVKVKTDAPPPIEPNKASAKVTKDPGKMTDEEYLKWRKTGKAY